MTYLPLTRFEYVDDGMYNHQWNIFAQVFSKEAAEEIFFAVNYMRGQLTAKSEQ